MKKPITSCLYVSLLFALSFSSILAQDELPDPDGQPADMSKPVQVYILLGQSNMLGFGKIEGGKKGNEGSLSHAVKEKKMYPYLVDDAGNWTERKDVRNVQVMGSGTGGMKLRNNEWMTIKKGKIGPEIGIGHHIGHVTEAPVLILKSCIGNRSLGWDLLPPGSEPFDFEEKGKIWHYAGYKETPLRWEKGTEPEPIKWYAGMQYDGDIARTKKVLEELDKYYPGAKSYEVAGFFFWQGDKDRYNAGHAERYEQNLAHLIRQLRKDFDCPNAKFVCATLGQTKKGADGNEGKILEAQLAVDGTSGKYEEFVGNVASVYSHPLSKGGASNGHYGGNAETYMNIGEAMGKAMVGLLEHTPTITCTDDLEKHVGQTITLRGKLVDGKVPTVLGVMVPQPEQDLIGKEVEVTGKLNRETVKASNPASQLNDGQHYDLRHKSTVIKPVEKGK